MTEGRFIAGVADRKLRRRAVRLQIGVAVTVGANIGRLLNPATSSPNRAQRRAMRFSVRRSGPGWTRAAA